MTTKFKIANRQKSKTWNILHGTDLQDWKYCTYCRNIPCTCVKIVTTRKLALIEWVEFPTWRQIDVLRRSKSYLKAAKFVASAHRPSASKRITPVRLLSPLLNGATTPDHKMSKKNCLLRTKPHTSICFAQCKTKRCRSQRRTIISSVTTHSSDNLSSVSKWAHDCSLLKGGNSGKYRSTSNNWAVSAVKSPIYKSEHNSFRGHSHAAIPHDR